MLNPATEKLVINNYMASYTMLYAQHNFYLDDDVVSKVAFYKTGSLEKTAFFPATEKLYTFFTLKELTSNSAYTLNAAFYDQMASDVTLVNAKIGINLSDTLNFSTAKTPSLTGIEVVATSVDVGVADPTVVFTLDGYGQTILIQAQKVGSTDWLTIFDGAFSEKVSVIVPIGEYKFRVCGRIMLPDGISLDISSWYQYPLTITVNYLAIPPTTPSNLVFKAAKIKDGIERYDVQVSWTWQRGSGAQVKEFILQYVTTEEYVRTGWTKASVINNSTAQSVLLSSFPFNKQYTFRVGVTSWGQGVVWSTEAIYIVDQNTVFDQAITSVSSCEIGYYGIRAYVLDNGVYKQSFLVDSATGAVSIGTLDNNGKAPFTFDPTNKILNVDGKVITNDINAANFILTNTGTGSTPKLYSQEKPYYSAPNSGVFIGRNGNGAMQFDVGNSASYLRFDGTKVRIAGEVVIGTAGGDIPLDDAIQGKNVVFIYKTSATAPTAASSTNYPPSDWSSTPTAAPCWISQGQLDPATGVLLSGTSWSSPIKLSGDTGATGATGATGPTGPQGIPGTPGINGITTYTWIKYADSSTGSGISNDPTGKTYIGFAYNKTTPTESNTPSDYTWSLIKGTDGLVGPPGADGITTYTWIKYSDNADGTGLYDIPTSNTKYIGIAVNKTTATESTLKTDYVWSLFKGDTGATGATGPQGVPGTNGVTTYTWIKYADSSTGSGISNDPTGKTYIGFAYNKTTAVESDTPSDYTWSLIKGTDGVQGPPGANGITTYTWIKYSDNADGTGLYDIPTSNTKYIGIAVNKTTATESTLKTDYVWSLFKGDTGPQGPQGPTGPTGSTGSRGPGIYAYAIDTFSAWADSYATTFFSNNFGTGPAKFDVLTQYNTTNPTIADTKMWNGSAWASPSLVVHGDAIVDGTIRAGAMVADDAFLAKAGINIIYDRAAALSTNPEANYKMKIDLANGLLHIR